MTRRRIFSFLAGLLMLPVLAGQGCTQGLDPATAKASQSVDLQVWGVLDDIEAYQTIFSDYHAMHPNVNLTYRRLRLEEYESALVNAMAEDRGPDIFLVHNTWVTKYRSKIAPMPLSTTLAYQRVVGTIKKDTIYQLETDPTISIKKLKDTYPDAVAKDAIRVVDVSPTTDKQDFQSRVMAIPLSVDTLGMYVNKDLLNAAGIATIPATWDKFQAAIPRLVKQDTQGNILQAGAALGTGYNIARSADIIAALMMQNGAEMSADDGSPTFQSIPAALAGQRDQPPSFQAVSFYTDFANPAKEVYTWNTKQSNSLGAFVQGKSAFFFGYGYDLPTIRAQAPKLNLGIAQLPQIEGNPTANFANYWMWTVSKKAKNTDISWNLVNFMAQPDEVTKYLAAAKRPAADKSLLPAQLENEDIGVFASQVLTSKSWYRGNDPAAMEDALKVMVENVLSGVEEIPTAVNNASAKISQTTQF